jgi:hypothetical protein
MQKAPPICTGEDHLQVFGLSANEIVKTPLGVRGTVLGVKYTSAEQAVTMTGGKLWVLYETGLEAPVEWEPAHGYARCSPADHIHRDVLAYEAELERIAAERAAAEEAARMGLDPAVGGSGGGKSKDKGGATKKKKK